MSSDDASDDSGFDKEAEREKLREKYEQDERDRENTRRMSELLLQGATMTGKHCGECGDPIFRYDGQEFCPTCQREVEGGASQQGGDAGQQSDGAAQQGEAQQDEGQRHRQTAEANSDGTGEATEDAEETGDETADERTPPSEDEPRVEINDVRVASEHADPSNVRRPPSQQGERTDRGREGPGRTHEGGRMRRHGHGRSHDHDHSHERTHAGGQAPGREADAPARDAGDLATARDSLVRKLTDLARQAEETDDVARARDLLAATREAAEALAALDRANR